MLRIHWGMTDDEVNPDSWFEDVFEPELLLTDFSRKLLKDIAHCEVVSENLVISDVLGAISPDRIGSGCKAILYLMYEEDAKYGRVHIRWLGDNLAGYLREVAKARDITMDFDRFFPVFPVGGTDPELKVIVIDSGKRVYDNLELDDELIDVGGL